ncbi:hypothetical protein OF83DRAFT_1172285 [Amylostereum chailletii]|nr:hypothetical protein OF83DRAFT_1172285 [Amylostereum chailletii]
MSTMRVEPVSLPARESYLPVLFRCLDAHPGRPAGLPVGQTYVYEQDVSKAALKELDDGAAKQEVPKTTSAKTLRNSLGFLELNVGDTIFARKKGDPKNGSLDILQALVLDRHYFTKPVTDGIDGDGSMPDLELADGLDSNNAADNLPSFKVVENLTRVRNDMLGEENERGPSIPLLNPASKASSPDTATITPEWLSTGEMVIRPLPVVPLPKPDLKRIKLESPSNDSKPNNSAGVHARPSLRLLSLGPHHGVRSSHLMQRGSYSTTSTSHPNRLATRSHLLVQSGKFPRHRTIGPSMYGHLRGQRRSLKLRITHGVSGKLPMQRKSKSIYLSGFKATLSDSSITDAQTTSTLAGESEKVAIEEPSFVTGLSTAGGISEMPLDEEKMLASASGDLTPLQRQNSVEDVAVAEEVNTAQLAIEYSSLQDQANGLVEEAETGPAPPGPSSPQGHANVESRGVEEQTGATPVPFDNERIWRGIASVGVSMDHDSPDSTQGNSFQQNDDMAFPSDTDMDLVLSEVCCSPVIIDIGLITSLRTSLKFSFARVLGAESTSEPAMLNPELLQLRTKNPCINPLRVFQDDGGSEENFELDVSEDGDSDDLPEDGDSDDPPEDGDSDDLPDNETASRSPISLVDFSMDDINSIRKHRKDAPATKGDIVTILKHIPKLGAVNSPGPSSSKARGPKKMAATHRPGYELQEKSEIRATCLSMLGCANTRSEFPPQPTPEEQERFLLTGHGGPKRKKFRIVLSKGSIRCHWNREAARVVVRTVYKTLGDSVLTREDLEKHTLTHFRRLVDQENDIQKAKGGIAPTQDDLDKEKANESANRRRELANRRGRALDIFGMDSTLATAIHSLGYDGMSEDEDEERNGKRRRVVRKLEWREDSVTAALWVLDALHLSTHWKETGKPKPGKFPEVRVRSNRLDKRAAVPSLPRNFYKPAYLSSLKGWQKRNLGITKAISIKFDEETLEFARRYQDVTSLSNPPRPKINRK